MDTQVTADYAALVAQAVGALLLGALLLGFHRQYQKGYLRHWAWSWLAFCLHLATTALGLQLSDGWPADHPLQLLLAAVSGVAGYLQLAFVIVGAYQLEAGRPPQRVPARLFPAFAFVGLATSLLFVTGADGGAWRYFARVGLRALAAFAAFLVAGLRVWESRLDTDDMSSACSCTVRHAGMLRPMAHLKASAISTPSGSPFFW